MKSLRVIILFFVCCIFNIFYLHSSAEPRVYFGLYINDTTNIIKSDAELLINELEHLKAENSVYASNDFKQLAIGFAKVGNTGKANEYLKKYIQNSYDVKVLNIQAFDIIRTSNDFRELKKKYMPELNLGILFLFATGLIGIFVALILNLNKKADKVGNFLISVFILIHSLFIFHLSLFFSKYNFSVPHSLYASTSFSFLYGPLIYFYFKRITQGYVFKKLDVLHLIPTLLLIAFFMPIYLKTADEKLHLMYNRDNYLHQILTTIVVLKAISLSVYGYLIARIYFKSGGKVQYPELKKWKRNMLLLNSAYVLSYFVYGFALINIVTSELLIYPQAIAMSVLVLYVAFEGYTQPKIFSKKYLFDSIVLKYQKSGLTDTYSLELKAQLLDLLNIDKVFRINDLNLNSLSEIIGTSRHNLSQVINEHFHMNFFHLINKYRIEEAKRLLAEEGNNYTIIEIAYDVGFNNKVTFNKAFKTETGLTPSQFLKFNKSIYSSDDKEFKKVNFFGH